MTLNNAVYLYGTGDATPHFVRTNCFEPKIASRLRNVQTMSLKIFNKLPSQTILQNPQNVFLLSYCIYE